MIGIYRISNTLDNRIYIGSSINFDRRKSEHLSELQKGIHCNVLLQNFVNKYGIDILVFTFIEKCNKKNLLLIEQRYLDNLDIEQNFNINSKAEKPPTHTYWLGKERREETLDKISKTLKSKYASGEITNPNQDKFGKEFKGGWTKGKKRTQENIENMRESAREQFKNGRIAHNKGKKKTKQGIFI